MTIERIKEIAIEKGYKLRSDSNTYWYCFNKFIKKYALGNIELMDLGYKWRLLIQNCNSENFLYTFEINKLSENEFIRAIETMELSM